MRPARLLFSLFLPHYTVNALSDLLAFSHLVFEYSIIPAVKDETGNPGQNGQDLHIIIKTACLQGVSRFNKSKLPTHPNGWTGENVMELGSCKILPYPVAIHAENVDSNDFNLASLPVVSMDGRDVLTENIYVGKAVLKTMFFEE